MSEDLVMNICSPLLIIGFAIALGHSSSLASESRAADQQQPFEPTMEDVSHLSCPEVWVGVAEKDDAFFRVVELLTHNILTRREVKFPAHRELGRRSVTRLSKTAWLIRKSFSIAPSIEACAIRCPSVNDIAHESGPT